MPQSEVNSTMDQTKNYASIFHKLTPEEKDLSKLQKEKRSQSALLTLLQNRKRKLELQIKGIDLRLHLNEPNSFKDSR